MLQTSARLLRLLSLFQAQRYWAGAVLTERLEVTARTLRRDVQRLRDLGYPVHSTAGAGGGYQLGVGATLPPLLLDDQEAVAIAVGLRAASTAAVTGIEESTLRALAKLEQILPSRLRRRVSALYSHVTPLTGLGPTVDANVISLIAAACRDRDRLRFVYRKQDGTEERRTVEPHQLVHTGSRWYLAAWDTLREDWRTFRVDRIASPSPLGQRYKPRRPPEGGFAKYVASSVSRAPYAFRARVILHANAKAAAERFSPAWGALEAIGEDRCAFSTGTHSAEALCVFLALAGLDFEVEEPPELVDKLRGLNQRFARAIALSRAKAQPTQ